MKSKRSKGNGALRNKLHPIYTDVGVDRDILYLFPASTVSPPLLIRYDCFGLDLLFMSHYVPLPTENDAEGPLRENWVLHSDVQRELEPSISSTHHSRSSSLASLTLEQRRRKWWRDGVVNVMFILSWYVASKYDS